LDEKLTKLSERERTIAGRYAGGETYKDIAEALFIAPATVRNHLAAIYRITGLPRQVGTPGVVDS